MWAWHNTSWTVSQLGKYFDVWSQSNLLQFCKQKSNQHHLVRMCVHHNFSCGGLLVSCDQKLSPVCLPPCRDWSCRALYSLLRQDVNKLTEAFGQARQRNCSEAFYGGSRKFNTQMLSIFWGVEGEQELKMESAKLCTSHLGSTLHCKCCFSIWYLHLKTSAEYIVFQEQRWSS